MGLCAGLLTHSFEVGAVEDVRRWLWGITVTDRGALLAKRCMDGSVDVCVQCMYTSGPCVNRGSGRWRRRSACAGIFGFCRTIVATGDLRDMSAVQGHEACIFGRRVLLFWLPKPSVCCVAGMSTSNCPRTVKPLIRPASIFYRLDVLSLSRLFSPRTTLKRTLLAQRFSFIERRPSPPGSLSGRPFMSKSWLLETLHATDGPRSFAPSFPGVRRYCAFTRYLLDYSLNDSRWLVVRVEMPGGLGC